MTTRIRYTIILALSALTLALVPAVGASASTSAQSRMVNAGAGQHFALSTSASSFQENTCAPDTTGDVVNLDSNNASLDEDRADITRYCASHGTTSTSISVSFADGSNPSSDDNWLNSELGIFIDTDGDDAGEYYALIASDANGDIEAKVQDRSTTPNTTACAADWSYSDPTLTISFDSDCLGGADEIAVNPGIIYDQKVTDPAGGAAFDSVFEDAFGTPLGLGNLPDGVTRLAGGERIATAIAVSQQGWADDSTDTVVLARADEFPDALAGTPLAIANDAPILLSATSVLPDATATEIERVLGDDGTVILLGGVLALDSTVESDLDAMGYDTVRYGGSNRFETAVAIASDGLDDPSTLLAADGGTFQDAIIAGTAAGTAGPGGTPAAVLLTDGATVPPATQAYLDANASSTVTAIGAAAAAALPGEPSIAGADADETSVLVAGAYFSDASVVGISRNDEFPDGLTGGALIGSPATGPGPMLLTDTETLSPVVEDYLSSNSGDITAAAIFGGIDAVSQAVEDAVAAAI